MNIHDVAGTSDELLAAVDPEDRAAEGIPEPEVAARRRRAFHAVASVIGERGVARVSPLGPEWSSDIDVHSAVPPADDELAAAGWQPLDALLTAIGAPVAGQWAVCERGRPLARVDLSASPPPDPIIAVLDRCRRRGAVRVREVLELRTLVRDGIEPPPNDPWLRLAARREAALGGSVLRELAAADEPLPAPRRRLRRLAGARTVVRRRRVAIAVSGPDGAGKSTLVNALVSDLATLGIPTTVIWTRPGMRIGPLASLARTAKRLARQPPEPGIRRVGAGSPTALASRRGIVGWTWVMVVTALYLGDVWSKTAGRRGVVIFDRHLLDACATLDAVYRGVDVRAARRVVRWLLPRVQHTVLLDVDAAEARRRKPADLFDERSLEEQLASYRAGAPGVGAIVLDATDDPDHIAARVFALLTGAPWPR